jgi:hypothetical protein
MTHRRSRAAAIGVAAMLLALAAQNALAAESRSQPTATPSAIQFAHNFVGVTNQHASEQGDAARVGNAHCVQAAPGKYMCSYLVTAKGVSTCHLMQARWTPERSSAITVTLAGRTGRCGTLREAIQSLR